MSRPADPRPSKKPSKVRQACDACHGRKIRCDGCRPCFNCQESRIDCTYLAVHKKTGPRGPRHARKPLQRPAPAAFQCPLPSLNEELTCSEAKRASSPVPSEAFFPSSQMTEAVIRWCLDAYFKHKYPLTPILDRRQLEQTPTSAEQYGLITACCSVIVLSPEILPPSSAQHEFTIPPADFLISETLRSMEYCNLAEHPSLAHIQTSFFLYATFFCMGKDNSTWYYLQEAITMLQTLRLHEEATYGDTDDPLLATYARRMFWVLFITERAYALQRNRPIRLQDTLKLPVVDPLSSDAEILLGFLDLISLFRPFDSDFIANWNSAIPSTSTDSAHLSRLQCLLKYALPNLSNYSQVQQADLLISRQWLKTVVWKLCASKTMLSTANSGDVMSLHYPASIARDIVLVSQLVPTQAFEANGIGILEKVFDVGCSLADLLSLVPLESQGSAMDVGAIDTLMEMVRIVGTRFGGSYRHLNMLVDKASRCLLMNVDRSLPLPADECHDSVD
ncbi:RING-3 [Dactylonectria macrodidyma]|uniref:RING-3 n=1 Tax=Dactylonectria macrodidyma TaxID=307937 RepID=A0A9P9FVP5_9HYPO|nr:RING-3 [Dactylonectria macrodidyma]